MEDSVSRATEIQCRAALPEVSVALRASAGSGKTKVLVDRFIRLCVEDTPARTHPRSILAITFTRKAAVEIKERLLEKAAKMVLAEPDQLRARLRGLFSDRENSEPSDLEMRYAAGLYEMVLEDLSGLHVGTIHSFCQIILGRFAAEAGLDPHFAVIENRDDLMDEALDQLEQEMSQGGTLAAVGRTVGPNPSSVRLAVKEIFHAQMGIERWLLRHDEEPDVPGNRVRLGKLPLLLKDLRAFLFPDLDPDREPDPAAFAPLLTGALEEFIRVGLAGIDEGMGADAERTAKYTAKLLASCRDALDLSPAEQLGAVRGIFLTTAAKTRSFALVRDAEIKARYNALVVENALPILRLLHTAGYLELYALNRDLLHLGLRTLDIYSGLKRRDRVVDFQDLEDMACRLMGDQGRALSLLYRLDDSIHHILLDEFQDTNFNQWDMLEPFVSEFLSGDAGDRKRTLFFVGDMKQAIYGFRGAEPVIFTLAHRLLRDLGHPVLDLPTNFRSLGPLVQGVGCLFNASPLGDSFPPEERESVRQEWAPRAGTGEIRVLTPYRGEDPDDDPDDDPDGNPDGNPVDGRSGDQLAADAAARLVLHLKESGAQTWDEPGEDSKGRPLRWSDFLVLTRLRTDISLYEKAFRVAGIPIVPPGRGMLTASREVQDILAVLRWLVWPEDDVALAAVLRSPIFRVGHEDFQELLARRGLFRKTGEGKTLPPRGLWHTLRMDPDNPVTGPAVALLESWRKHLGFEGGHELLRRIYREGLVLEKYQHAVGDQARYNLMRLYDLALSSEVSGTPTVRRLADYIARAARRGGQEEGTLPDDGAQGRVRFMTIHGAKGLEAPVVLLVDADRATGKESPRVRTDAEASDTPLLFKVNKSFRQGFLLPDEVSWTRDPLQKAAAAALERDRAEEANLLYVAMTRARDRLYVLGGDKGHKDEHDSPLRRIRRSADAGGCDMIQDDDPDCLERPPVPFVSAAHTAGAVGAWTGTYRAWQPPVLKEQLKIITPSTAEGEIPSAPRSPRTSGGRVDDESGLSPTARGDKVHQLLQLAAERGDMPPGSGAIHDEAAAVFANPDLAWIFRPDTGRGLSEVPIIHRRAAATDDQVEERITGAIDRLVLRPGRVDIIDYKSNRFQGDPEHRQALIEHYRPQLAAYREVVQALYPDSETRTWLLFTDPAVRAKGESPLTEVL